MLFISAHSRKNKIKIKKYNAPKKASLLQKNEHTSNVFSTFIFAYIIFMSYGTRRLYVPSTYWKWNVSESLKLRIYKFKKT